MAGDGLGKESRGTAEDKEGGNENLNSRLVSVNMLCIIGATVGLASIFLPWHGWSEGLFHSDRSLVDILWNTGFAIDDLLLYSCVIFAAGTLLAFAFPLAGLLQAAGLLLFLVEALDIGASLPANYSYDFGPSIGYSIGALSTAMVLAGFLAPQGPGHELPRKWWQLRTDVVARVRLEGTKVLKQTPGTPRDLIKAFDKDKPWAGAWIVAAILLLLLVFAGLPSADEDMRITGSVEGVAMSLPLMNAYWEQFTNLTLTDGVGSVNWSLQSPLWDYWFSPTSGCVTPVNLGERNLSGLALELTVIDWSGEGVLTPGDFLVLTPTENASFAEGTVYEITMQERSYGLDSGVLSIFVTFEFSEDGVEAELETEVRGYGMYGNDDMTIDKIARVGFISMVVLIAGAGYYILLRPGLVGRE
ncbi:MAG: hypothetical protein MUC90_06375 [Thermoplasmata archaeon]|jgi:hypothetical protein|nr:hypothetical protein [Thermoplasmata archaeon]